MFTNTVKTEWLLDSPRDMRVIEPISFIDKSGKSWDVPEGAIINGASIPKFAQPIIGTPYIGKYRRASVIHDYYYETREYEKDITDDMFYEAMIFDGVPHIKAHAMLLALQTSGTWAEYDASNDEEDDDDDD